MACRRMLTKQGTLFQRWCHPSLSHNVHLGDESDENCRSPYPSQPGNGINNIVLSQIHNGSNIGGNGGIGLHFGWNKWFPSVILLAGVGPSLLRNMSSTTGEGSDNVDHHGDITGFLTNKIVEIVSSSSQVSAINEVAVATADSAFPVAALQYLNDGVQTLTGLSWWATIAITTLLIKGAILPFHINQIKRGYKHTLTELRLKEMKQKVHLGMDPGSKIQKEFNAICKLYGYSPITLSKLLLLHGSISISFLFAISNMVEKVPSFKNGGTFWFTDLTTPDSLYICPVLVSLIYLVCLECNTLRGLKGNPLAGDIRISSWTFAILAVPLTMGFPKVFFCYWITSRLFVLSYGLEGLLDDEDHEVRPM